MKFKEYIYNRISELSCRFTFGVPGYYIMPLWQCFTEQTPQMVLATHEASAVYMADGWWRSHRQNLAFVFVTLGPGLTNAVTGIASAYKDSIPIVIISGQTNTKEIATGCFQECSSKFPNSFSPVKLFQNITKASFEITHKENAIELFEKALSIATSDRKGPVHLSIPLDIQEADIEINNTIEKYEIPSTKNFFINQQIISIVNNSQKPLLLLGGGVFLSQSEELVQTLSQRINAPIITTIKGLTSIDKNCKNFIGHIGHASNPNLSKFLEEYDPDLLIVLGASLSSFYLSSISPLLQKTRILNVNIEHNIQKIQNRYIHICSDLHIFLQQLIPSLQKKHFIPFQYRKYQYAIKEGNIMAQCISSLNDILPKNTVVVPDAGNHWLDTLSLYCPQNIHGFFTNAGLAGMSHAIGFSLGLSFSRQKRVICITGDGSFLMGGNELITAKKYNLDIVVIVFNNRSLGRIRIAQEKNFGKNYVATNTGSINFSQLANALGIKSYRVATTKDFRFAIKNSLREKKAVLIEVLSSPDELPVCLEEQ